jgi:ferredoxin
MPTVEFLQVDREPLRVDVASGALLIDIVRPLVQAGQLALAWRCGQGTCGACQIYCRHAASGQWITISSKERNVLVRHAEMPINMPLEVCDTPQQVRLACHYIVEHDVQVWVKIRDT